MHGYVVDSSGWMQAQCIRPRPPSHALRRRKSALRATALARFEQQKPSSPRHSRSLGDLLGSPACSPAVQKPSSRGETITLGWPAGSSWEVAARALRRDQGKLFRNESNPANECNPAVRQFLTPTALHPRAVGVYARWSVTWLHISCIRAALLHL